MAKQNNSLTELQALEGIYEHLSTIYDLAKEVGVISTRLRKIEEQLKEPIEITDPMLNVGNTREYSRNTCIYGALIKSIEACIGLTEQKNVLNDVVSQLDRIHMKLDKFDIAQSRQNEELIRSVKIVTKSYGLLNNIVLLFRVILIGVAFLISTLVIIWLL